MNLSQGQVAALSEIDQLWPEAPARLTMRANARRNAPIVPPHGL
jgi:hypothetical protein